MKLIFNILWLDVNNVNFLSTLYQIEKTEEFMKLSMIHVSWDGVEKERKKRKIFQNKCVSSQQTKCAKMAPP
jgi:hypothetical protein